ncbi:alanine racemase [Ornithinimicrobium pratense]|uniref:Alanine racemase n=1 Tax=Ornithinimicrobium pratense TaxID=2593973 RepID=A0A5J6V274_9MICO|nr:alanine racemase [Ornithinimicrobium pratense]QFG67798.1 alanine racemase [Ornithinimicrobium pratense]
MTVAGGGGALRAGSLWPARVTVDLGAIRDNVRTLRERVGGAELMAVVKADAYGHGLVPSARAALAGGACALGVAQPSEAIALREAAIDAPVLTWLVAPGVEVLPLVEAGVEVAASTPWTLDALAAAARASGTTAVTQLKADTGLARNGAFSLPVRAGDPRTDWTDLVDHAARLAAEGVLRVRGLFTHFSHADAPRDPTVRAQQEAFADAVAVAERAGLDPEVRHMSNSAATLTTPAATWDMVRPGLAVYGLTPVPDLGSAADYGLRPAMRVAAAVAVAKRLPAGQGVSYGHTYAPKRESTVVDVPLGYADGVPRHGSNLAPVQVGGQRFTIAGRVCMDQFVVDVGDLEVGAGDEVVLFGAGDEGEPTAQEWADAVGTISYEIVTRFGPRVPRVYRGGES